MAQICKPWPHWNTVTEVSSLIPMYTSCNGGIGGPLYQRQPVKGQAMLAGLCCAVQMASRPLQWLQGPYGQHQHLYC